jgi:hypothetical protein
MEKTLLWSYATPTAKRMTDEDLEKHRQIHGAYEDAETFMGEYQPL